VPIPKKIPATADPSLRRTAPRCIFVPMSCLHLRADGPNQHGAFVPADRFNPPVRKDRTNPFGRSGRTADKRSEASEKRDNVRFVWDLRLVPNAPEGGKKYPTPLDLRKTGQICLKWLTTGDHLPVTETVETAFDTCFLLPATKPGRIRRKLSTRPNQTVTGRSLRNFGVDRNELFALYFSRPAGRRL
jgi:hypothetical protein